MASALSRKGAPVGLVMPFSALHLESKLLAFEPCVSPSAVQPGQAGDLWWSAAPTTALGRFCRPDPLGLPRRDGGQGELSQRLSSPA